MKQIKFISWKHLSERFYFARIAPYMQLCTIITILILTLIHILIHIHIHIHILIHIHVHILIHIHVHILILIHIHIRMLILILILIHILILILYLYGMHALIHTYYADFVFTFFYFFSLYKKVSPLQRFAVDVALLWARLFVRIIFLGNELLHTCSYVLLLLSSFKETSTKMV